MTIASDIPTQIDDALRRSVETSDRPVAVVTGASSGIGRAIVENLVTDHLVIAVARNRERLAELSETNREHILPLVIDLADVHGLTDAISGLPRVDALVHDAAIAQRRTVEDATPDDWQRTFNTNVIAPATLTRALLPQLRESRGTVIFVGSGAARRAVPFHTVYSASKHALLAVADGLRQQVAPDGVRVSTVAPGPTSTPLAHVTDDYPADEGNLHRSEPETVATAVRFVIEAPADSQFTELWVRPRH